MVGGFPHFRHLCLLFLSLSPSAPLFCFHHLSFVPLLTSKPAPMHFTQPQVCLRAVDVRGPGPAGDGGSACLQRHAGMIDSLFQPTGYFRPVLMLPEVLWQLRMGLLFPLCLIGTSRLAAERISPLRGRWHQPCNWKPVQGLLLCNLSEAALFAGKGRSRVNAVFVASLFARSQGFQLRNIIRL